MKDSSGTIRSRFYFTNMIIAQILNAEAESAATVYDNGGVSVHFSKSYVNSTQYKIVSQLGNDRVTTFAVYLENFYFFLVHS